MNPVSVTQSGSDAIVAPEAMILYPENSEQFKYIQSLIGEWDYYISHKVVLNATAQIKVMAGEREETWESQCEAYIYGWMPGTPEWIPGSCVAIVYFAIPKLIVPELPSSVTLMIKMSMGETVIFNSKRTVPIYYAVEESLSLSEETD